MSSYAFPSGLPSLAFSPDRFRPYGIGYWSGHIPFACDLIATMRPSVLVELGTHTGQSYFTFCQAIAESGIECRAFAVDTWQGDEHTGAYGNEVFDEVTAYNRERYRDFSQLLRMPFDVAAERFGPETIDLLHIDGAHTYDAVRHDFDTWWPKVKRGGVVLLHDSFERHHDFGVWKLLDELHRFLPVGEFFHSHGLGVVLKSGSERSGHVAEALVYADETSIRGIRRYYEVCAQSLECEFLKSRSNSPSWDVTSQLFWRQQGEEFTEGASVRSAHVAGPEWSEVKLVLPALSLTHPEFRIALTLVPALLELRTITITDARGAQVREWFAGGDVQELRGAGLHALATPDNEGALILNAPAGSQINLPIGAENAAAMRDEGTFSFVLRGLDAMTFSSKLAAIYDKTATEKLAETEQLRRALNETKQELDEHRNQLAAVRQSLAWRIARRLLPTSRSH